MVEPAHADDGPAAGFARVGQDFEYVSMPLALGAGSIRTDFLTAEPGSPWRDTAGAIAVGAAQAGRDADPVAVTVDQVGGAATGDAGRGGVLGAAVVNGRRVDEGCRCAKHGFMITHQHQLINAALLA
jgi:hypothetical protein